MIFFSDTFRDSTDNVLEYGCYGEGELKLVYFPGFGESFESVKNLASRLEKYTVIGINLYGVGSSIRTANAKYLSHEEWQLTFSELLDHLKINRFSVLGFSLGGRFSVSTFRSFNERMDVLILAAPDGIVKRFTYQLSTFPVFFQQLFYMLMKNPKPYFILVHVLQKLKLINPYVANFSMVHMNSEFNRMLVYSSWVMFKHLRLKQKRLTQIMNESNCRCTLIFGEKDKIISPRRHLEFLAKLKNSSVIILPFGHNKLVDNAGDEISQLLS